MKESNPIKHRESWLGAAASLFDQELFRPVGFVVPSKLRISVGFPFGRRGARGQHAIGQCWAAECSADGTFEIFISPTIEDSTRASDILIHELVHATVGLQAGHGKVFRRCALAVGLSGRMTATVASNELKSRLSGLLRQLPDYPHRALTPISRKKQGTRLIKIVCPSCGWTGRTTARWLAVGTPTCPCGDSIVAVGELGGHEGE